MKKGKDKTENKEKLKKIRAISPRRMDFYYRIQSSPQRLKQKRRRNILITLAVIIFMALAGLLGIMIYKSIDLQNQADELTAYVEDEKNVADVKRSDELNAQAGALTEKIRDVENVRANVDSYPLVTSKVFETLEDGCPDKVSITITGYDSSSGTLSFDAVAPEVTDVSDVIEVWKKLDIFQNVYYTGYTKNNEIDLYDNTGYTVKVVCVLSEDAGRQVK